MFLCGGEGGGGRGGGEKKVTETFSIHIYIIFGMEHSNFPSFFVDKIARSF